MLVVFLLCASDDDDDGFCFLLVEIARVTVIILCFMVCDVSYFSFSFAKTVVVNRAASAEPLDETKTPRTDTRFSQTTVQPPPPPLKKNTHTHSSPQVEQAIFLSLMRLREKMGAAKPVPGRVITTMETAELVQDSRRARRDENIGDYTRTLWSSLGAGNASAAAAAAAADQQGGERSVGARGVAREGGGGVAGRRWAGKTNNNQARLLAFLETLAAGESALSPGVFEVGGARRAEVRVGIDGAYPRSGALSCMGLCVSGVPTTTC